MECFNFSRWKWLMQQWGLTEHGPLFEMLQDAYRKEGRYYHTASHVDACLKHLDKYRAELNSPDEVELALWFHDVVYDPFRQDNELKSAEWAKAFLQSQNVDPEKTERVYQLIMATCHGALSDTDLQAASHPDQNWMLDIDLAILGAPTDDYRAYEQAIRNEYRDVPLAIYCQKRAELLKGFLQEASLYQTEVFRAEREQQARDNMCWACEHLQAGEIPSLAVRYG